VSQRWPALLQPLEKQRMNVTDLPKPMPDCKAQDAFAAYATLQMAQRADPALTGNAYFQALLDSAYARFLVLFERAA
jgi:hypothetical protein